MGVSLCFLNFYLYKVVCYGYFNFRWSGLFTTQLISILLKAIK